MNNEIFDMNDKQISDTAKAALEQQANALDSKTLQRLRLAREAALFKNDKGGWLNYISWKWLTGAGAGLAIASILTFMIVPQLSLNKLSPLDDLELLTADVDLDLVDQLEFYQWLDETLDES